MSNLPSSGEISLDDVIKNRTGGAGTDVSLKDESQTFPTAESVKGDVTKSGVPSGVQAMYGDATLTVMSAKNNPVMEVRFFDLYPVSLGGLAFDQQLGDTTYLTATATFTYKLYEMFTI